ncbi:MAG: radical SAM protein [Proteobacteria bacterium]|nr:radical SAM protein [Pseudomonadota bacterium]
MEFNETDKTENSFDYFIQWHLTERCNLACTHCYQEKRTMAEMTLPEINRTLQNISNTIGQWSDTYEIPFSTSFNITGGEPLLRKDLLKILQKIQKYKFNIYLLTNGTMIKKENARLFADIPVKGVQVSLEGPEEIHEAIRGKHSFSSALKGVQYLLDEGTTVTLNVTLSEINEAYFSDMVMLATDLGVQRLGFSRLVPYGRGLTLLPRMLKKEKVKELYESIFSINTPGLEIVTGDPVASQLNSEITENHDDSFPDGGCAAGVSGITLLPDGTITPCRRLGIPIGHILKDSLREIWAASNVLNALRNKSAYKGKCRVCKRWSNCRGCRAIAYAYSLSQGRDDFLEEDPQCFIE